MADETVPTEKLSTSLQESVLTLLTFGGEKGQIAAGMLSAELFEEPYADIARRAIEFRQRYGSAPGVEHIDDLFDHVLNAPAEQTKRAPVYQRILIALHKQSDGLNEPYVLDRVTEFIRRQTYKAIIYEASMRIQRGGDGVADDVEAVLNKAFAFRAESTHAGIFMNEAKALSFMDRDAFDSLKLGIEPFDRRDICPTRGELLLFVAPRGRGKSWFATHCSTMALLQRWRVCDVTLEMSEDMKAQRIFQNMLAMSKRTESHDQTVLEFDSSGFSGFRTDTRTPTLAMDQADAFAALRGFQAEWNDALSRINIRGWPSGSLTVPRLRAHLDFLEQVHHFSPDMLVVDYPQIMQLEKGRERESLGRTVVDLRGLAQERNMAVVALHQSTREGEEATSLNSRMVSDDISVVGTADMVLYYNATKAERQRQLARLYAGKVRTDKSDIMAVITQDYATGQFVLQAMEGSQKDYFEQFELFDGVALPGSAVAGSIP
jgi:hypothetical protein